MSLLFASLLSAPSGSATVTSVVTGPAVVPASLYREAIHDSLAINVVRAPLFLLFVPLGPLVLERREYPGGTVMVKRGMPFEAIFHPFAHLMRFPWEPERVDS